MAMQRQGDLLIVQIDELPENCLPVTTHILAEGEATGHAHRLDQGQIYEREGALFFHVPSQTTAKLCHEEHHTLEFPAGLYKVIHQREYQPESWRRVAD